MRSDGPGPSAQSPVVSALDVLAKLVLLVSLAVLVVDPEWGNLEGKAPTARALTYPLLAIAVPVARLVRPSVTPYPWLPDLLLTLAAFSDILGNRLDLYDQVWWFDDSMHVVVTAGVTAALVLLTTRRTVGVLTLLERSVALGMSAALAWELFEYVSFLSRSSEVTTAYGDTVLDLALGWAGAIAAALLVHVSWRHHLPVAQDPPPRAGRPRPELLPPGVPLRASTEVGPEPSAPDRAARLDPAP